MNEQPRFDSSDLLGLEVQATAALSRALGQALPWTEEGSLRKTWQAIRHPLLFRRKVIRQMVAFLCQMGETQLQSLHKVVQANARSLKLQLADNPLLKITGCLGFFLAIVKVAPRLLATSRPFHFFWRFLQTPVGQELVDLSLEGLIVCLFVLVLLYLFYYVPRLSRNHFLDYLLTVAIEQTRLSRSLAPGS